MGSPDAAIWMALGEWRAHPARIVLAALAIAVGVALGLAVHLVNQSALAEFARAIHSVNGEADLQVHSSGANGFDETLYPRLARHPAVAYASPVVEMNASLGETRLTLLGLDPLRAAKVTPSLLARGIGDEDALALSPAAGRRIGDKVTLAAGGHAAEFTVAAILPDLGSERMVAVIDIATAQYRFGQLGRLQRIDLKLKPGRDAGELAAALPADAAILSERSEERRGDSLSRAYRVNLDMLAMVALLTGGFLVYSAQSLSVTRRQTQFALLRVLGQRRGRLLAQICAEGTVVGMIGALIGIALGTALAALALRLLGGDLGGGYFHGSRPRLIFEPWAAAIFLVLGAATAVAGSWLPAQAAAKAQPAVALKNFGNGEDPRRRPNRWIALALVAAGGLAALAPPLGDLPLFGYASIGLLLAGGVAAMPWLARGLLRPLLAAAGCRVALDLAAKRLWGAPQQAAIALGGIVASTSLTIAMVVMVASFRGSVEDWLVEILPADLYLRLENAEAGGLDADAQAALAAVDGVAHIDFRKGAPLRLAPDRPAVALISRSARSLPLLHSAAVPPGRMPVWVSEPFHWLYGAKAGDELELPLGGARRKFFVAGIWRDYGRQHGALILDSRDYQALTGDRLATEAAIDLQAKADPAAVIAALRAALPPELEGHVDVARPALIRAMALRLFDRSFAVTYGLEAIAILVGLSGVAATLSAQTIARAKEFGVLRHLGVRRGQIVAMLAAEGAILGGVGMVAGTALGVAMSQVLIHVINPQSFHWTMRTRLPWTILAAFALAMIVAASVTAILAGRRALSVEAVRAVREDW